MRSLKIFLNCWLHLKQAITATLRYLSHSTRRIRIRAEAVMVTLTRTLVMLRGGRQGWPRPRPRPSAEGGPGWCRCRTVCWGRDGTPPMPGRGRGWTRWPGLFRYYLPGAFCTLTKQNYKFITCRAYKTLKEKLPNNEKIISKKQIVDQVSG